MNMGFLTSSAFLGAVASIIARYFQDRAMRNKELLIKKENERKEATTAFTELSSKMDGQYYAVRQVYLAFKYYAEEGILDERWDFYRDILYKWNSGLNLYIALAYRHFGIEMGKIFEQKIIVLFRELKIEVESAYFRNQKPEEVDFEKKLEALRMSVRNYNIQMLTIIQEEKFGTFGKSTNK